MIRALHELFNLQCSKILQVKQWFTQAKVIELKYLIIMMASNTYKLLKVMPSTEKGKQICIDKTNRCGLGGAMPQSNIFTYCMLCCSAH